MIIHLLLLFCHFCSINFVVLTSPAPSASDCRWCCSCNFIVSGLGLRMLGVEFSPDQTQHPHYPHFCTAYIRVVSAAHVLPSYKSPQTSRRRHLCYSTPPCVLFRALVSGQLSHNTRLGCPKAVFKTGVSPFTSVAEHLNLNRNATQSQTKVKTWDGTRAATSSPSFPLILNKRGVGFDLYPWEPRCALWRLRYTSALIKGKYASANRAFCFICDACDVVLDWALRSSDVTASALFHRNRKSPQVDSFETPQSLKWVGETASGLFVEQRRLVDSGKDG